MKKVLVALVFASLVKANAQLPGPADCTKARDQYTLIREDLSDNLYDDSDEARKAVLSTTKDLTGLITRIVAARLVDTPSPSAIRSYLACMQEREDKDEWGYLTNTPQVFVDTSGPVPLAISSVLVMGTSMGPPATLPLVQCFAKIHGNWKSVPNPGDGKDFYPRTLFIHELESPRPDESWYLLSSRVLGGTGGIFRLEVLACGANAMRTVWTRDEIVWGEIEIPDKSSVLLTYQKQEDPDIAEKNGDKLGPGMVIQDETESPKHFSELLRVTPNGLEP